MNRKEIQIAVCKALLDSSKHCAGVFINEDDFAITTDGFTAFVFDKKECVFDISKIKIMEALKPIFQELETDVELKKANCMFCFRGKTLEKYTGENLVVYVDSKVAKPFKGYRFFASSNTKRILVKDQFDRLLGIFLPVKFDESEAEKNA